MVTGKESTIISCTHHTYILRIDMGEGVVGVKKIMYYDLSITIIEHVNNYNVNTVSQENCLPVRSALCVSLDPVSIFKL